MLWTREPIPLSDQPYPDSAEYADSARRVADGRGYSTVVQSFPSREPGVHPPRYPPGYSLAIAPFALFGRFPNNVQLGAKVVAILAVAATGWAAYALGGVWTASLAVLVVGLSPFARVSVRLVMADALAVGLTVVLLVLLRRQRQKSVYVAGLVAGFGVVVRLSSIVILGALLVGLSGADRLRAAFAASPPIAALAMWQWVAFGRPWRTGYGYWLGGVDSFNLAAMVTASGPRDGPMFPDQLGIAPVTLVCPGCHIEGGMSSLPSLIFYPLALAGILWVFAPPLLTILGGATAVKTIKSPEGRFVIAAVVGQFAFFLTYFHQGARFVAPSAFLLVVMGAATTIDLTRRAWRSLPVGNRN